MDMEKMSSGEKIREESKNEQGVYQNRTAS
jgi:hypothetical protein